MIYLKKIISWYGSEKIEDIVYNNTIDEWTVHFSDTRCCTLNDFITNKKYDFIPTVLKNKSFLRCFWTWMNVNRKGTTLKRGSTIFGNMGPMISPPTEALEGYIKNFIIG